MHFFIRWAIFGLEMRSAILETDISGKSLIQLLKENLIRDITQSGQTRKLSSQIDPDMISSILSLARFGISQNEVLSHTSTATSLETKSYVDSLLSLGLIQIEKIPSPNLGPGTLSLLYTTEKGFRFLRSYKTLVDLVGWPEEQTMPSERQTSLNRFGNN